MVSVDRVHRTVPKFRERLEQICARVCGTDTPSGDQLGIEFGENPSSGFGVKGIEEGRATDRVVVELGALLQEVPPAGDLTDDTEDTEADERRIVNAALVADAAHIVGEDAHGRGEELIKEQWVGVQIVTGEMVSEI